jgi:mono/diheme cytochrome c family protein
MKRSILLFTLLAVVTVTQAVPQAPSGAPRPASATSTTVPVGNSAEQSKVMVTTYCTTCHSSTAKMGGLALDGLSLDTVPKDAVIWEKAVRKLRGRLMPPPGAKQPEQKDVDSLVSYLETRLDSNTTGPKAGYVAIQRMNRTEYAAAV